MSQEGSVPDGESTAEQPDERGERPVEDLSEDEQLAGELARLEAENSRLREEYARSKQTEYRQTAIALVLVGAIAAGGAVLFVSARTVLFALAGTGVFLGILTYYLAPEQFLPASVGREVYGALAESHDQLCAELGLSDRAVYIPTETGVRLYVPQTASAPLPEETALDETFVVTDESRGVAFQPTGGPLFAEFERALTGSLAETPDELTTQLTDALVEQFELVESIDTSVSGDGSSGQVTVGAVDSPYGPLDQFDHPLVSVLAVGLARGLDQSVEVTVERDTDRADALVTCRWPATADTDESEAPTDGDDAAQ